MRKSIQPSIIPFGSNFESIRLAIEYVPPARIQLTRRKLRKHGEAQVRELAAGIGRAGFNVPLIVDEELKLVSGHARLAAAEMLELENVPVIRLAHLTEEQLRLFAIFENRIAERAEWDEAALVLELEELRLEPCELNLTDSGFAIAEIDTLVGVSRTAALSDFDDVFEPQGPAVTAYLCELSPHYVDVAVCRFNALGLEQARLAVTGQTFDDVKADRANDVGGA